MTKPSPTQRRQNGVHVVYSTPPPSSTSHWIVGDRRSFCGSSYVCPRPWGTPGLWHVDGHALVSACQFLLRRLTTNTLYPSIVAAFVVGNTDGGVLYSRLSWRWCSPDLTMALRPCRPSETALGQSSVCAECCCTTDFHSSSSRPRPASTSQPTLASSPRKDFVPTGGASVSLSPRLCIWLPGVRSAARLRPQHTSATVLFQYVSACRSTDLACYYRRPCAFPAAAASVWNSLPESVRASPSLPVFRSRLKTVLFARSYTAGPPVRLGL